MIIPTLQKNKITEIIYLTQVIIILIYIMMTPQVLKV